MRAYTAGRQRGGASRQVWTVTPDRRVVRGNPELLHQRTMLDDDTRYRLLRLLTEHPNHSQRELASELGLSLGKTNYSLRALIARGWVKVQNFRNSNNKLGYAYVLTPTGVVAKFRSTADFLRRKQGEYARLEHEIAELRQEVDALARAAEREGITPPMGY